MNRLCWLVSIPLCLYSMLSPAAFYGIQASDFMQSYRQQKTPMWCWAASAEMVLANQGVLISQEEIIQRATGMLTKNAGSPQDLISAANGVFKTTSGKDVLVSGQYVQGAPFPTVLFNQIAQKKPVILTYYAQGSSVGHAIVVTAIDADVLPNNIRVNKVYVFDPFSYRVVPWGAGTGLVSDPQLITKTYDLLSNQNGVFITPGIITGVILMDATEL